MWAAFYCSLILFVHILSLAVVSSTPNHAFPLNNQGQPQNHQPMQITHSSNEEKGIIGAEEKEDKYKEIKKIGSKAPSCEKKCYGCMPCEAIQVPTATATSHVGLLYTNYEPEGWKCKCGHTLYGP